MPGDSPLRRLVGLAFVLAGKVLGQGALLVYGMVVAHAAGPEDFALFAVILNLVLLADACLGSPVDYGVIRFTALHERDPERADRLHAAAFRLKFLFGVTLVLGAVAFGPDVARGLLRDKSRVGLIEVAAGLTLALLLNRSVATFVQSKSNFRVYSLLDVTQGLLRALVLAALAFLGARSAGAYFGGLLAASAALLLVSLWLIRQPYFSAGWPSRKDLFETLRFVGVTTGVIVLSTMTGRTDLLFLTQHAPADIAHYAGASQMAAIASLVAAYGSVVAQPILIPAARQGRALKLLGESLALGIIAAGVFLLVVWGFGGAIMRLGFGPGFEHAAPLLTILSVGTCIDLITMPLAMTFILQFRPRLAICGEILITAVYLGLAGPLADAGPEHMAWLVTGVRIAKGALYIGGTLYVLTRPSFRATIAETVLK